MPAQSFAGTLINIPIAAHIVSRRPHEILVAHSLGACIGLSVYDPEVQVGGILHCVLPDSRIDRKKAGKYPCMFADTGIPLLLKKCIEYGAEPRRLQLKVAGAADLMNVPDIMDFGKQNYLMIRKIFMKNKIPIHAEDVGGSGSRTMMLFIETGQVVIRSSGSEKEL